MCVFAIHLSFWCFFKCSGPSFFKVFLTVNFESSLCMLDMSAIGLEEGGRQGTKPLTSNIRVYRCVGPPETELPTASCRPEVLG